MSVIVLGTASHTGKSTIVAALCRALVNRGITVAPFKSQNMSLNSYVTPDGCEIGIAQAMQAFAAKIIPGADMNPILLKPKGEMVSQVVLLGHPYKDVVIAEYYKETDHLLMVALAAADRLCRQYGNIVVEGAGGAAEINLYSRDIANIRLSEVLNFPIILVADIERGGVFASVYGTLELLPPKIRSLVRGIIINKFRGDPGIFSPGTEMIEQLTGVPVLGILPYFDIPLPSEDSLSLGDKKTGNYPVRIAVIRLPHISNFTDFELLERYSSVTYVPPGANLSGYDCIIIPGTKNTIEDLGEMHHRGTVNEIIRARESGVPVIGICGGFQMLGKEIHDSGVESKEGSYPGLGLLDGVTRFTGYEKHTIRVVHQANPYSPILSGMGAVEGYEIHMGTTERGHDRPAFDAEGAVSDDGIVIGTYMHGLLTNPGAVNALLSFLYNKKGEHFTPIDKNGHYDHYDELANLFEQHINMDEVVRIFKENPGISISENRQKGQ
ncbi:MAG TPA: cobyric acid synthase [Methanoregulaceae archaeon]|nr:cobyric acid synthase [Methanoregulaceae archaeon]